MAIVRTPLIDDDGSGFTGTVLNNAWQNGLYNAIDAATIPTYGTFTPIDLSGAGLIFQAGTKGLWSKYDRIVCVWLQVVYPSTATTNQASIGGLPYLVRSVGGATHGYGLHRVWWLPEHGSALNPQDALTGLAATNTAMSGANVIMNAVYLTD